MKIFLLGQIPHNKVLKQVSESNILIFPSRYEAFRLLIIEAMSIGTPVIASNVGGIPELIRDGIDGYLISPDDPELLAEKVILLFNNSKLARKIGESAYTRFLKKIELSKAIYKQAEWIEI